MKRNTIVITIIVVTSIVVTNGLHFLIRSKLNQKSRDKYESQIAQLNATIEAIGPLTDIYTISKDVKEVGSGLVVVDSDLEEIKIPESCIQENFVLDKYDMLGKFYKIDIKSGTPLTQDMFMAQELDNTSRDLDITADIFPVGLKVGDYVDLRLIYPRGEDYIVLSHMRVNEINDNTIKVVLREDEILFYDSAVIENFVNEKLGSMTYFVKYTEPGVQEPAKVTYSVPQTIINLLDSNPNIVESIQNGAVNRDVIDASTQGLDDDIAGRIAAGRGGIKAKLQSAREAYDVVQMEQALIEKAEAETEEQPFTATDANGLPIDLNAGSETVDTGGVE